MSTNEEEYILRFETDYEPNPKGIGYELYEGMNRYRNRIAQIEGETGKTETYDFLLKRAIRLALRLKEKNLQKTDIISVCSNNHLNVCLPLIAASFLYIRFSPLDPVFSTDDYKYFLNLLKPKILFIIPEVQEKVQTALKEINSDTEVIVFDETFEKYLQQHVDEDKFEPVIPDSIKETWDIHFSSGSTGLPKGICLSQYALMNQMVDTIRYGRFQNKLVLTNYEAQIGGGDTIYLYYSQLYWITGLIFLLGSVVSGSTRVVYKKFDPEEFWEALTKYEVTNVFTSPTMLFELAQKARVYKGNSLFMLQSGGAKTPIQHITYLQKFIPNTLICQVYGQTEVGGYFTCTQPEGIDRNSTSCGRTVGKFNFKIVDPETNQTLPLTESGELRIKSPYMFNGYYKSESSAVFDEDGWFKTGDIVRFDGQNNIYLIGRCKDMVKYKGHQLSTVFLEEVVMQHPCVKQAVIVGVQHESDGEHPAAVVILSSKVDPEEIRRFVDAKVNDVSRLRGGVRIVDNFPLTATGKINRFFIQKMINSGQL